METLEILIKAGQLILSLSILVVLHELGHFIPAKLFKTRVEKFYLFFDPWFSLFKIKKGETEYGIGWLPLGGYVKISGMIDESMDTEQMKQPAQPWEFRSKPAWQRLIIMSGGVIVNFILGFIIYAGIVMAWGVDELDPSEIKHGVAFDQTLLDMGFENGDNIVAFDDTKIDNYFKATGHFFFEEHKTATVNRNGDLVTIPLPQDIGTLLIDSNVKSPISLRSPSIIGAVTEGSPADSMGLQVGDLISAIDAEKTPYFNNIVSVLSSKKPGDVVQLTIVRNDLPQKVNLSLSNDITIGFELAKVSDNYTWRHIEYGFGESIAVGFSKAGSLLRNYVHSLRFLFSKAGAKQVGSFLSIGNMFAPEWDWQVFWNRTAFLSLILAVMNLLPIPALDGGHIVFLFYEMIAGKPAPEKFMEKAQLVGVILLIGLMILALGNDIIRFFFS
ncbi:MAG: RIP metalloprotease RseP [Flavobacteriales bacterium]